MANNAKRTEATTEETNKLNVVCRNTEHMDYYEACGEIGRAGQAMRIPHEVVAAYLFVENHWLRLAMGYKRPAAVAPLTFGAMFWRPEVA